MCSIDDAEPWDVFNEKWVSARRQHRCVECRRTIEKGERYRSAKALADHEWHTYRTCEQCQAGVGWLAHFCHGYIFTTALEDLIEHTEGHDEEYLHSAELAELISMMEAQWLKDGTLLAVDEVKDLTRRAIEGSDAAMRGGLAV